MFAKYSLLSFPIASFGLGVWQLRRLEWKKDLIANLEDRLTEEPLDLSQIQSVNDLSSLEYRRFKVRGKFDQDVNHQLYLKPRQLVVNKEAILRGRSEHQFNSGVNVVSAFLVDGSNLRILVNRGWLPLKSKSRSEDSAAIGLRPDDGVIDIIGILRLSDKRYTYGSRNDETTNELLVRDIETMSRMLKTAPIFLDLVENPSATSGPIGGQTQLSVRNEHLNYAITWFGLAALSYIMWYSRYGKRSFKIKSLRR